MWITPRIRDTISALQGIAQPFGQMSKTGRNYKRGQPANSGLVTLHAWNTQFESCDAA